MVNLLFISNSPKMDMIKRNLQPVLKVKIDVVTDFDYGLKDVFEKRPATVFIQEQIAGVTGESVARHIQMLLGSGAPSFIFMHEESSKVKPIKGLFEHLVDLTQSDVSLIADIQATLKALLGPQWEKIYIPPKVTTSDVMSAGNLALENRTVADQLVDDLLSDLENPVTSPAENTLPTSDFSSSEVPHHDEPKSFISSEQEQLAEMLAESARRPAEPGVSARPADPVPKDSAVTSDVPAAPRKQKPQQPAAEISSPKAQPAVAVPEAKPAAHATTPASSPVNSPEKVSGASLAGVPQKEKSPIRPSAPVQPPEFRIGSDKPLVTESVPEDLLLAFEDNYRSELRARRRITAIVVIMIVCLGCVTYVYTQKPKFIATLFRKTPTASAPVKQVIPVPQKVVVQKPESSSRKTQAAPLPTFIPQTGVDAAFASQNPGWERFLGSTIEYRVFRSESRIKAVQVMAKPGHEITASLLKAILKELTGSPEYRVTSRGNKSGLEVVRATANNSAELLIYRNKTRMQAFVVSL